MNVVAGGVFIIGTLILSALLLTSSLVTNSYVQGSAFNQSAELQGIRLRTSIALIDASSSDSNGVSVVNVQAGNNGSVSIVKRVLMDMIIRYTAVDGQQIASRLSYSSQTPLSNNEWTFTSISPDVFNSGMWDPGEQATFQLKVSPAIKSGTIATVAVVTPNGVDVSRSFTHP